MLLFCIRVSFGCSLFDYCHVCHRRWGQHGLHRYLVYLGLGSATIHILRQRLGGDTVPLSRTWICGRDRPNDNTLLVQCSLLSCQGLLMPCCCCSTADDGALRIHAQVVLLAFVVAQRLVLLLVLFETSVVFPIFGMVG